MYVDAACYVTKNRYSNGAGVRDAAGRFVKAMTSHFVGQSEVQEAEAHGLLITLQWIQQFQLNRVEIEMDCLNVVQSIAGRMQANRVAHELAQVTRSYVSHYMSLIIVQRIVQTRH
ncbi:cytochrome p450 [Trifolium pratense]|uniref:Cytochrome p450 n=1 Tax=Trifolium pratense TaxID=57577 RepID=A0A2K3NL31_TRIPR|nr:cytochrome p450 [Trifolium pratense]